MKRAIRFIIFPTLFLLVACTEDIFKEVDQIKAIDTNTQLKSHINGAKAVLNDPKFWEAFWLYQNKADEFHYGIFSNDNQQSDVIYDPYMPNIRNIKALEDKLSWSTLELDNIYSALYTGIISLNRILTETPDTFRDQEHKTIYGEAYLYHAYYYYLLVRFYNKIPIVQDAKIKYDIALSQPQEVYNVIVSDLKKSIELLPLEANQLSFYNVYTSKALLAEVYLSMAGYPLNDIAKYKLAAELSSEIIESGLYSLNSNYEEPLQSDNHSECLFPFYVEDLTINSFPTQFDMVNKTIAKYEFYNSYPNNFRKKNLINTYAVHLYEGFDEDLMLPVSTGMYPVTQLPNENGPWHALYFNLYSKRMNYNVFHPKYKNKTVGLNIIHYSHILLCYAESKARMGELDQTAYNAINRIRRRANKQNLDQVSKFDLATGLTPEQFRDSVLTERRWELCGEIEGRWFDIIRLNLLNSIKEKAHPQELNFKCDAKEYNASEYFAIIPESEYHLNLDWK